MVKYFVCLVYLALILGGGSLIVWTIRTRKENYTKKQTLKFYLIVGGLFFLLPIGMVLLIIVV